MSEPASLAPNEVLEEWVPKAPIGRALDLGAGEGETARWLAERGFQVDAVEADPQALSRLARASAGWPITPHHADLLDFSLPLESYALIVAQAVLHFLPPSRLPALAAGLCRALRPGGVLIAEVLTTDDPGRAAFRRQAHTEIEPNTFQASFGLMHYFRPLELQRLFLDLQTLYYEESRRQDPQAEPPYRSGATLIARRPDEIE
jgi:SAM-dependent methyltransferase